MKLVVPCTHLNEISQENIIEAFDAALTAIGDALVTIQDAVPNAGDYCPSGHDDWRIMVELFC